MLRDYIRKERQRRKWSQTTLAGRSGLTQTYISALEREPSNPSMDTVQRLATAFEMSVNDLLAAAGEVSLATAELLSPGLAHDIANLPPDDRAKVEEYVQALHALHQKRQRQGPGLPQDSHIDDDPGEASEQRAPARGLRRARA